MPATGRSSHDPLLTSMERAFRGQRFISYGEGATFVAELEGVRQEIVKLQADDPARAARLFEVFLAGCEKKGDYTDDSDGELGGFACSLVGDWVRALQAAGSPAEATATLVIARMADDPYGHFSDAEREAVAVMDGPTLAAFEGEAWRRFEAAPGPPATELRPLMSGGPSYMRLHWGGVLRTIYRASGDVEKYLRVCEQTQFTVEDCREVAVMLEAAGKAAEALAWVDRGINIGREARLSYRAAELTSVRRRLLATLGREGEALDSAWGDYCGSASRGTYEELMLYAPQQDRAVWHERAMKVADDARLDSAVGLLLAVAETGRLADRLGRASDGELEEVSHYVNQPAAKHLRESHPVVAARVYRALGMRIVKEGKSRYYAYALSYFDEAKRCYERAGDGQSWRALVDEVRRDHRRKSSFMPGFEAVVKGRRARVEPSFLDEAMSAWTGRRS